MERIIVSWPLMISLDVGFRPWLGKISWFRVNTALGSQRISFQFYTRTVELFKNEISLLEIISHRPHPLSEIGRRKWSSIETTEIQTLNSCHPNRQKLAVFFLENKIYKWQKFQSQNFLAWCLNFRTFTVPGSIELIPVFSFPGRAGFQNNYM